MGVWWIAWLGTLAAAHLTDGKLNSRQMPQQPLPTAQGKYQLHLHSVRGSSPVQQEFNFGSEVVFRVSANPVSLRVTLV